jgi:hypothetical protein
MELSRHDDPLAAFIVAACVPLDRSHASGTRDRAELNLAEHPEVASSDIHTAAILGDDAAVRRFIERDAPYPSGYAQVDELLNSHGACPALPISAFGWSHACE